MTHTSFTRRKAAAMLLAGFAMLPACDADKPSARPTIRLWLDAPVSEVTAGSTYAFSRDFANGSAAGGLITTPHVLVIDEPGFSLRFEEAGGLPSLPTSIGHSYRHDANDPPSWVAHFAVHPLPEYVTLRNALGKAKELREVLLAQGFAPVARSWQSRFTAEWEAAPASLDRFEDLEEAFLSSRFFAKSANVFNLEKGRINVELQLVNARRKWGSRVDLSDRPSMPAVQRAEQEAQTMSRSDLLAEKSYALKFSVGPTVNWRRSQRAIPRGQLERDGAVAAP